MARVDALLSRLARPGSRIRRWRGRDSLAGRDRGQLLLIGAFGIAVLLLVFAGVMNTVTYTETLATQDGDYTTSRDVAAFQADAQRGVTGILDRVNDGSDGFGSKVNSFSDGVESWSDAADREHLTEATGVTVRVTGTTRGSRITQSSARNLTNANGAEDWELAASVDETRQFRLALDRGSLDAGTCSGSSCYEFVVDDGSSTWRVSVSQSDVTVDGPGFVEQCNIEAGSDPVTIDVVAGTVDGDPCGPLTVTDAASSPYDIRYRNGINASGTYRLVVRQPAIDNSNYAGSGSPSETPIIYSAQLGIEYRNPRLTYSNEVRVSGGESDG